MKDIARMRSNALTAAALLAAAGLLAACSNPQSARPPADAADLTGAADPGPGRGCLRVVAEHPYSFRGWRFDETAQALAHASGCVIRYTDPELAALRIAPVEGRMSIRDAVEKALAGSAYAVERASETEIVVAKKR